MVASRIWARRVRPAYIVSIGVCFALGIGAPSATAQRQPEVRQIVTFLFSPGATDSALAVYRRELLPAYAADSAMRRFRVYSESESPEPLDLIVVSSFDGMAGMDASNALLRARSSGGRSVFQWYGVLSAITQRHHDQFTEMIPQLGTPTRAGSDTLGGLTVIEYTRVAPGARAPFEALVASILRAESRENSGVRWSETGRLLVSDGWDYVRFSGVPSLGAWHDYLRSLRTSGLAARIDHFVVARKTIIVRQQRALDIR
ncbi:MAG: hypothetical protein ABIT38_20960 [Gemmatimonadaceae bacterium]